MPFLPFYQAKNLVEANLTPGYPWDFCIPEQENFLKRLAKDKRRQALLRPATTWNVYTATRGFAANLRVSKQNPASGQRGLIADYDMVSNLDQIQHYLNQQPAQEQPNFISRTLSDKIHLIWVFEREVLVPSNDFCQELVEKFFDRLKVATLLPGFDPSSARPTEMWTNGGMWYDFNPKPLLWTYCFGIACETSKKASLFNQGEIALEAIAEEVERRWPGRWHGAFQLDALGVRFWDEKADCPTGCQVKPDGMLCFTGTIPFMKWSAIFGQQWTEEKRVLNLGKAGENVFFDGKNYWEKNSARWEVSARVDIMLRLKGRGLSDRCPKGATQSDVERVLDHIQQVNRVQGAAPLINYAPGLIDLAGRRILNTVDLYPVLPVPGPTLTVADFPWHWIFLQGFFTRPELKPLDYFLTWLRRAYQAVLFHERFMGQAVFICGPKNNGKTLLGVRIVVPLLGNRAANPMDYMVGETTFNSELFAATVLAIHDEDAPNTEARRARMLAKLKGLVVNPVHKYHAKFEKPVEVDWQGRIFVTLNDDPGSVGMLLEVSANTRDKQMYFASRPYASTFPPQKELEATIARELPYFGHWLLYIYEPLPEVISDDRMGVKSFFDPHILELANWQTFANNLVELLRVWMRTDAFWNESTNTEWTGTPTDLLTHLQTCDTTAGVARDWTQVKVAKSLVALAKQDGSGISFIGDSGRDFRILPA